jgi:hypothetical protein
MQIMECGASPYTYGITDMDWGSKLSFHCFSSRVDDFSFGCRIRMECLRVVE